MRPTRILFFAENRQYGGLERYLFDLCNSLAENEMDVRLAHNLEKGFEDRIRANLGQRIAFAPAPILTSAGITSWIDCLSAPAPAKAALKAPFYPLRYLFYFLNIAIISKRLKEEKPDVLHIINGGYPGAMSCSSAAAAGKLCGVPRVTYSVLSMPQGRKVPFVDDAIDRVTAASVDLFLPNCDLAGKELQSLRGIERERIMTIYSALKEPPRGLDGPAKLEFRSKNGVPGKSYLACYVAAFEPMKGHDTLLRAFKSFLKKSPDAKLALVGDGKTRQAMENLARGLGMANSVIFAGYCDKACVDGWVSSCDLFVFPSLWEGLPYSVEEAMHLGKPIVATRVGGIPELIQDRKSGLLVPPSSASELADAMSEAYNDRETAARYGKNAKARAGRMVSIQAMLRKIRAAYQLG